LFGGENFLLPCAKIRGKSSRPKIAWFVSQFAFRIAVFTAIRIKIETVADFFGENVRPDPFAGFVE